MVEQRTSEERRIVCAAIQNPDGRIVCGARHYDQLMIDVLKQLPDYMSDGWRGAEQGFVDQFGKFLTREEAWDIAYVQGRILPNRHSILGVLHSEDLY